MLKSNETPHRETSPLLNGRNNQSQSVPDLVFGDRLGNHYLNLVQGIHLNSHNLSIPNRNIVLMIPAIFISTIAIHAYIGPSLELGENTYQKVMNLIGSLGMNDFVNIYYMSLALVGDKPLEEKEAIKAYENFQNLNPSQLHKIGRAVKTLLLAGLAVLSGYPFFVVDKDEDSKLPNSVPAWIRNIPGVHYFVWASFAAMQYTGIEKIATEQLKYLKKPLILPWLIEKAIYNKKPKWALYHLLQKKYEILKDAHLTTLNSAHQELVKLIQQKSPDRRLEKIYEILDKREIEANEIKNLLSLLFSLGKFELESAGHKAGRLVTQGILSVGMTISLLGYLLSTAKAVKAVFGSKTNRVVAYGISALLFAPFYDLAITLVCAEVGATIFNKIIDFGIGMYHKIRGHEFNEPLIKLNLNFQLNPILLSSTILIGYFLSYYSTPTSRKLNQEQLGEKISKSGWIDIPTVVTTMIFNAFPADKIIGVLSRTFHKTQGTEINKKKLRAEEFILELIQKTEKFSPKMFFTLLEEIAMLSRQEESGVSKAQIETTLKAFLGNISPQTIISVEESGQEFKTLTDVILFLKERKGFLETSKDAIDLKNILQQGFFKSTVSVGKTYAHSQFNNNTNHQYNR